MGKKILCVKAYMWNLEKSALNKIIYTTFFKIPHICLNTQYFFTHSMLHLPSSYLIWLESLPFVDDSNTCPCKSSVLSGLNNSGFTWSFMAFLLPLGSKHSLLSLRCLTMTLFPLHNCHQSISNSLL